MDAPSALSAPPLLAIFCGIFGLPALAGLLLLRARPRAPRLSALAAVAALVLAAQLALAAYDALGQLPGKRLQAPLLHWLRVGTTTELRLDLLLDPHSGALVVIVLLLTLLTLLPYLRPPLRTRAAGLATSTAAAPLLLGLALALLSLLSASLLLSLAAWSLLGLLTARPASSRRLLGALGELGLWLTLTAALAGAGGLTLDLIHRSAALAGGRAFTGAHLLALDLATLAALGLVLALLGRGLATSLGRGLATPEPNAPLVAFSLLIALDLALRLHPLLALAHPLLWPLAAALSALLLLARLLRARPLAPAAGLAAPFVVLALALGAWGTALALLFIHAFALATYPGLPAAHRRRLAPVLLLALLPAHTVLLALAWASPGRLLLTPLLLLALIALAAALTRPHHADQGDPALTRPHHADQPTPPDLTKPTKPSPDLTKPTPPSPDPTTPTKPTPPDLTKPSPDLTKPTPPSPDPTTPTPNPASPAPPPPFLRDCSPSPPPSPGSSPSPTSRGSPPSSRRSSRRSGSTSAPLPASPAPSSRCNSPPPPPPTPPS
jgi:hypothetical protein